MIRSLRALAWMRFRLFVNSMMKTGRRDTLEQISRALASVLPVALLIALVPSALALGVAGFFGGRILGQGGSAAPWVLAGARLGLLVLTLMVVLLPVVRSAAGPTAGLTRLLLLPIPRRVLLLSELTAGFGDPWLALTIPLVLAAPLGLASVGSMAAALLALGAAVALLAILAALNASSALVMNLAFRNRRRGEWLTLIFAGVLSVAFVIPLAFPDADEWLRQRAGRGATAQGGTVDQRLDAWLPAVTRVLPSELYAGAVKAELSGGRLHGFVALTGLLVWCVGIVGVAGAAHSRLLESPPGSSRRGASRQSVSRLTRYPGLGNPASAVARAMARSTLRTVRGRIAVYLNFPIVAVALLVFRAQPELEIPGGNVIGMGQLGALASIALSTIALQPVMLNLFAADGSGLTLQFLAPISRRDLVLGKMAAGVALITASVALCTAASAIIAPGGQPVIWAALLLVHVSAALIVAPISVVLSAVFPKHADLSRMGKAGNPHNLAGLFGFFLVPLAMAPATAMTAVGLFWLDRPLFGVLLPAAWTIVCGLSFLALLRVAVSSVDRRAENLTLVAVGK